MHNIETLTATLAQLVAGNIQPAIENVVRLLSTARDEEAAFAEYCNEQERQEHETGHSLPF
jgi:hypothetical protein